MLREDDSRVSGAWRLAIYVSETFSRAIEHADQKAALLSALGIIVLAAGECQGQLWITFHPDDAVSVAALGMFGVFALLLALSALFVVLARP
jgi:hypothetical protein